MDYHEALITGEFRLDIEFWLCQRDRVKNL